jgi:uncharacterized membrane protein (DUF2068 family)
VSDPGANTAGASDGRLGFLLACFDGRKTAGKARRSLETQLRAQGDEVLDTVVLEVDEKHKASAHDPRRIRWGLVTVTLVWGACGIAGADGLWSIVFWAAVGAIGGVLFLYYTLHHLTKSDLASLGTGLPAQSSALAVWVGTNDARRLLEAATVQRPTAASAAVIGADLTPHVFAGPADPVELPPASTDELRRDSALLSMLMLRYPSPETAKQMVLQPPADSVLEVEMMITRDSDGSRHVSDPYFGVKAMAKSDALWWGGFGLAFGALGGAIGGGGVLGFIEDGVLEAIVWGIIGLGVGALYGTVFGKAVSARKLKSIGSLLPPGTSILMAWVDAASPLTASALDAYATPGSQRLVLNFNSSERGAVLEAA